MNQNAKTTVKVGSIIWLVSGIITLIVAAVILIIGIGLMTSTTQYLGESSPELDASTKEGGQGMVIAAIILLIINLFAIASSIFGLIIIKDKDTRNNIIILLTLSVLALNIVSVIGAILGLTSNTKQDKLPN